MGYRIDIDHRGCITCGICMDVCPVEALSQIPIVLGDTPPVPADLERRRVARLALPSSDETH